MDGTCTIDQHGNIAIHDHFGVRGWVTLFERDYSACAAACCPHLQDLGSDPEYRDCPLGHPIGLSVAKPDPNKVLTVLVDNFIQQLNGDVRPYDPHVLYAGAGTSNAQSQNSTIILVNEVGRVAVSSTQKLLQRHGKATPKNTKM